MDWLPEGHLVYFILDVVAQLDLSGIRGAIQEKDPRGTQPYSPQMMVALLLYGYCVGVYSSRKLERATYEDVPFRVLTGEQHPHFTTINEFRRGNLDALRGLFLQVLKLCQKAGLVKLGHVALDGTKVQGNASKHKAMSYKRMRAEEKRLKAEIRELLRRAKEVDAEEGERFGEGERDEDLPVELRRREDRLEKIERAKAELEAEAKQARVRALRRQATRAQERSESHPDPVERKRAATMAKKRRDRAKKMDGGNDDDLGPPTTGDGLPKHEPKANPDGEPDDNAQMNFTDSESRIMEAGGSFIQGYNCQAAVDEEHQVIVGEGVSNKSPDNGNLLPMLKQVKENSGASSEKTTADSGYWAAGVTAGCEELGTDVYIATERQKRTAGSDPSGGGKIYESVEQKKMQEKLQTEQGRKIYARRKVVAEPVFGQAKECRGFRRFLLRGLRAVQAEWSLVCTGHNLLKLYRAAVMQPG
jgi:transposase